MLFIQVGQHFFAIAHIAAITLNAPFGVNADKRAVALYLVGDDEPWLFQHGTPEAEVLMAYAQGNALCLVQPK